MVTAAEMMVKDFVTVDVNEHVSKLIGRLKELDTDQAVILDAGEFVGIFSPRSLLKARVETSRMKTGKVVVHVPRLSTKDDVLSIAAHMYDADAAMLPVMDHGKVIGVVHARVVLKYLHDAPELQEVLVRQIRHPKPITMLEDERIDTALRLMQEEHIEHLPIVTPAGRISGMVTYRDLLQNYYGKDLERHMGKHPGLESKAFEAERPVVPALPVSNVMSETVLTIGEDETVTKAIERMVLGDSHALLILEDGLPTGIFTRRDVLEAAVHSQMPQTDTIQYVGLEKLDIDSFDRMHLQRIVARHGERLTHFFHNDHQLTIHIKERSVTGERHRFSVHLRITYPSATVPVSSAMSWNVRTAVQEAFAKLELSLQKLNKENVRHKPTRRTDEDVLAI